MLAEPPICAPPTASVSAPLFAVPRGACDCHAHVFPMGERQCLDPERSYTPADAPQKAFDVMQSTLGIQRSVIVQPSVYGTDNRITLASVAADPKRRRAAVVVGPNVTKQDLVKLCDAGAVGVRVNLLFASSAVSSRIDRLGRLLADVGMHLQVLADISSFDFKSDILRRTPRDVPVILDHFGHMKLRTHTTDEITQRLKPLVDTGRVWIKLSGAYRITGETNAPYDDVGSLAEDLISHNPERLVWGSDWPHPAISVPMPDDGALLNMLGEWCPNAERLRRILVVNPASLYGFEEEIQ